METDNDAAEDEGLGPHTLFSILPIHRRDAAFLISWVRMAPQTTTGLLTTLRNSRDSIREALAEITEEDASRSPGAGRWSALECVEHLTIAEEAMLGRLKDGEALAEPIHLPEREARMAAGVSGRVNRVQAPPTALPTGRFASMAEALERFCAARGHTIEFVETAPNLRALQVTHPFFGPVSGYELAVIMAAHSVRHAAQIREIREQVK
jgi:hypothetical protein